MPRPIDESSFAERVLGADRPVIVDFGARWCAPCKQLERVLGEVEPAYAGRVEVFSVDVDDAPALAQRYGVRSMPTLLGFRNGEVVAQQVGFSKRARVQELFDELAAASGHAALR
jgi:thioredoxin 1